MHVSSVARARRYRPIGILASGFQRTFDERCWSISITRLATRESNSKVAPFDQVFAKARSPLKLSSYPLTRVQPAGETLQPRDDSD